MDRAITLQLVLTLMLLVLYPTAESKWIPHHPLPRVDPPPLCASQLALVNHACALLPYTRVPPPSPLTHDSRHHHHHDHGHGHSHSHSHGHGHRHSRHGHKETTIEEDCCRWLKELDDVCVCELLVRLPPFLTRPVHNYTVGVDDMCNITFTCGSRLVPL